MMRGNYIYSILRSQRSDAAFEKGVFDERDLKNWIGLVTLLDENQNELGTFDSTGADLVQDPKLIQWAHDVRSVDWPSLESGYGNTIAVASHLIRFAVAEDAQSRYDALSDLYSYICYQDGYYCSDGTTYESSAYAIPLLIRLSGISTFEDVRLRSLALVEHISLMTRGEYDDGLDEGEVFPRTQPCL